MTTSAPQPQPQPQPQTVTRGPSPLRVFTTGTVSRAWSLACTTATGAVAAGAAIARRGCRRRRSRRILPHTDHLTGRIRLPRLATRGSTGRDMIAGTLAAVGVRDVRSRGRARRRQRTGSTDRGQLPHRGRHWLRASTKYAGHYLLLFLYSCCRTPVH